MTRYTIFATRDGQTTRVKADPANLTRQQRDLTALGYSVTILDDDECIRYGRLAQQLHATFGKQAGQS
jgi:hypothetical protein